MTKKSDAPAIRFKGFSDAWEQRKLGELCNITTGKLDANAMVSDGQYDFYTSGIDVFKIDVAAFEGPAITIAGNGASVGYMHLADGKFNAYQRTYVLTDFLADRQFLNVAIGNELPNKIQEEVRGSGIPYIVLNMLTDLAIPFPSHEEQYAIGVYFQQLDNLITLHQRKFEKLTNVKKSMLEKMFPQNGSSYPEIRFKGFTDPWEQRKLGELALFNPKDELPQTFEYVDLESVVGTEMLSHRTEVKSSAPSRAQRLAHTGDLFYQTVRPYQKNNYLYEKPDNNYVFSTGYAQMRPYVDGYFLLSLVQSERFVKVVLDNCTGTSYPAINANDLAEIEVAAPSDESEAQKIGTIFRSIDNLITLHQREFLTPISAIKMLTTKNTEGSRLLSIKSKA